VTAAEAKILSRLIDTTTQLPGWRTLRQAGEQNRAVHLAVLVEPYLTYILDGRKTIESRLSKHAIAPFRQVAPGDLVLLKLSGGPVIGCFTAGSVEFVNLNPTELTRLSADYSEAICVGDDFWEARADKRYATLVGVRDVRKLRPARVTKADQRGWVVLRAGQREPAGVGEQLVLGVS
jgi:hypothetical protein